MNVGIATQGRLSARRSDTTAARLAEVGRRWCHCLYAREAGGWQRGRDAGKEERERGEGRESVVWLRRCDGWHFSV